jgi:cytochrome c oxidase subunit 3
MSSDAHGEHDAHSTELHLPHGSWWPFWLANSIAVLLIGMIMLGRSLAIGGDVSVIPVPVGMGAFALGIVLVFASLIGWFKQDVKWWNEGLGTGEHVPKAGILLFIGSEVFLFGALFTVYFSFKGLNAGHWPDAEDLHLPLAKTLVFSLFLFSSSWTIHKAEHHIKNGNHKAFVNWWGLTILLGLVFLAGQVWEYSNLIREGHTLGSSQFVSAFFMLTGTHGLHVFGGLCALTVVWFRARKGQFNEHRHAFPQAASMYWHFVDFVWVIVYGVIYVANIKVFGFTF